MKHPDKFPPFLIPPEQKEKKGSGVYTCKQCGATFDQPHKLGTHMSQHRAQARKIMFGMSRLLNVLPEEVPKDYKIVRVAHIKTSTRIPSSYFIPSEWNIICIHKPVKTETGIWVYIEPMEVEKRETDTKLSVHDIPQLR